MKTECNAARAYSAALEEDTGRPHVHLWFAMLEMDQRRKQYREERRLSDELGFDIVDIGGEG